MATGKPTFKRPERHLVAAARKLRRDMTEPERILWRGLRSHLPLQNSHFRRQVALAGCIVDFCCLESKLVIEVDGEQHGWAQGQARDEERMAALEAQGFRILRFSNNAVRKRLSEVIETIWAAIHDPSFWDAGVTPTPIPSPQGGGGPIGAP